jgi:hypothetical protein
VSIVSSMSEVEVLLSVDAGRVPADAVVFSAADPEAAARRLNAVLAALCALALVGCVLTGVGRELVALLALIAGIFVVLATRTEAEEEDRPHKPALLVVTPRGMIVRDDDGLRTWQFEELAEVVPYLHTTGEGLLLVGRDGSREFLDNHLFRRGEQLPGVIRRHLRPVSS